MGKKKVLNKNLYNFIVDYSALIVALLLIIINVIFTPNFFNITTISNIVIQMTSTLLISLGMTWVIASGGIDISVGSVMALSSMVSVKLLDYGLLTAMAGGMLVGIASGALIGFLVARFDIQPMIVSMTLMIGLRGVAQILNDSKILRFDNDAYAQIGRAKIFGNLPIQILIMLFFIVIIWFISSKTIFGIKIEAVGDNREASRLSGINTLMILVSIYAVTGLLSSCAGIIETARLYASDANTLGKAIEMDAISAVAIGGTSMIGGKPNIVGTIFGVIIIQVLTTMVNMNNISYQYSLVLKAIVIVVALYGQRFLQSRKRGVA